MDSTFCYAFWQARPAPASIDQRIANYNFSTDYNLGLALKYSIAFAGVSNAILSESAFFSIEHVLEAETELDCSLLLASNMYYKQGLQVLRGFIEESLLPIHFCFNPQDYELWQKDQYRTPSICGREGLAQQLVNNNLIPPDIGLSAQNLYRSLNSCIHNSII